MRHGNGRTFGGTLVQIIIISWGLAQAQPFLIPLCLAGLISVCMTPLARAMRLVKVPDAIAIFVSALLLALPITGLGYLLINQGQSLIVDIPSFRLKIEKIFEGLMKSPALEKLNLAQHFSVKSVVDAVVGRAGEGLQLALAGVGAVLNAGTQLAMVLLFSLVMLASRDQLRRSLERILERNKSIAAGPVLDEVGTLIEKFLLARLLIIVIVAVVDGIILTAAGLKYSLLLASILGGMTMLPVLGFIIAALPPVIVALATGYTPLQTLVLFAALFAMSIIEGNLLTPRMVGRRLNINTLFTFAGLFAGGLLWGIWGILLSIPLLGVLRIALSASPELSPWGELMASRETPWLTAKLTRRRFNRGEMRQGPSGRA